MKKNNMDNKASSPFGKTKVQRTVSNKAANNKQSMSTKFLVPIKNHKSLQRSVITTQSTGKQIHKYRALNGFIFCNDNDINMKNCIINNWDFLHHRSGPLLDLYTLLSRNGNKPAINKKTSSLNGLPSVEYCEEILKNLVSKEHIKEIHYPSIILFNKLDGDIIYYRCIDLDESGIYELLQDLFNDLEDFKNKYSNSPTDDFFGAFKRHEKWIRTKGKAKLFVLANATGLIELLANLFKKP